MAITVSTQSSAYYAFPTAVNSAKANVSPVSNAEGTQFNATLASIEAGKKVFQDASCLADANYVKFSGMPIFVQPKSGS